MKKLLSVLLLTALVFTGCGQSEGDANVVKIGVSPAPHAEFAETIKDDLANEGITLEIVEFTDYVTPNLALDQGDIDMNFFQHTPYLESFAAERGLDLESLGGVHIEPMAVFSGEYQSLNDIPDGAEVYVPNDPTNGGRALLLLQKEGLITLKPDAGLEATPEDIQDNPKNLVFTPLEAAMIPTVYKDVAAAVINGNYALEHGLNPVNDSIAIEGEDSPYVNIIAVRKGDASNETYQKVLKAFQSDEIKQIIEEKYQGAVVPAF